MKVRQRRNRSGTISWQLDMGVVAGKRRQASYPTKEAALAALASKKEAIKLHGASAVTLTIANRHRFEAASEKLHAIGATIEEAVDFYVRSHPREHITLDELIRRCVQDKESLNKRLKYTQELRRTPKPSPARATATVERTGSNSTRSKDGSEATAGLRSRKSSTSSI